VGLIEALVLGLVGGVADFLPVSGSGHRMLVANILFGGPYDRGFAGVCEVSSALAAVVALRKEIRRLLHSLAVPGGEGRWVGLLLLAAAVPAVLISLPFRDASPETVRNLAAVGVLLLVSGLLLYVAEELGRRTRPLDSLGLPGALLVGLLQALTVLPGISRTGAAISGAMLAGITREAAIRFALLLSVPLLLFSGVWDLASGGEVEGGAAALGAAASFAGGYAAVRSLRRFGHGFSTRAFAYYLWVVGVLIIAYDMLS
jgi:undecaprenyl-diphosphatase